MEKKKAHILLMLFLLFVFALSPLPARSLAESERVTASHAIAIAYDNSGSMYGNESWSNAQYSLEVLAAMLDERDTLHIFTMDQTAEKVIVDGKDGIGKRVAAVHNTDFSSSGGTALDASRNALSYLEGIASEDVDEKYLIVTTDGYFNSDQGEGISAEEGIRRMQMIADAAASEGIKVIYLAIGEGAAAINEDTDRNIYIKPTDSSNILQTMTETANQVFGRALLPQKNWNADTGTMTFDIPIQKIVVLAQGDKSNLGSIKGQDITEPGVQATVKWVDSPTGLGQPNKNLQGKVGVYDNKFKPGDYSIDISGSESAAVYYMPDIDIAVTLTNPDGTKVQLDPKLDNTLPAGEYTFNMSLVDPTTGKELTSTLLEGAELSASITQGSNQATVQNGSTVTIEPLETELIAEANVPGGVHVIQQYKNVEVLPEKDSLDIDVSQVPGRANIDRLGPNDEKPSGTVTVFKSDGTELSVEEWSLMALSPQSNDGLNWRVTKSENEKGVFNVTLDGVERDYGVLGWLKLHMFSHVSGVECSTTFTAEVASQESDLHGVDQASTLLVGNFYWWIWVIIGILAALILRWITRPKLPKLRPAVDIGDGKGYQLILGAVIRENKWPSLAPEKASFDVKTFKRNMKNVTATMGIERVYLVAVPPRGHGRSCKLDAASREAIKNMMISGTAKTGVVDNNGIQEIPLTRDDIITIKRNINGEEKRCRIKLYME